ncbi:MAG: hypothetical protein WKF59_13075 [Chitinophagaceae bacterium]
MILKYKDALHNFIFHISVIPWFHVIKISLPLAPQLKYESVNNKVFRSGDVIQFTLSFTDAEGDIDDSLYVEKFEPKCEQQIYTVISDTNFPYRVKINQEK